MGKLVSFQASVEIVCKQNSTRVPGNAICARDSEVKKNKNKKCILIE